MTSLDRASAAQNDDGHMRISRKNADSTQKQRCRLKTFADNWLMGK